MVSGTPERTSALAKMILAIAEITSRDVIKDVRYEGDLAAGGNGFSCVGDDFSCGIANSDLAAGH